MPTATRRAAIVVALAACAAAAQPLDVHGSFRTRLEMWDWFEGAGDNAYAFSGNLLRLGIGQQRPAWDWQVEFAAPLLLGLPDNALAPPPQLQLGLGANYYAANGNDRNAINFFPKQAFVRLKNLGGAAGHSLRLGRFEFLDGSEAAPADSTLAAVKRDRIVQRLVGNFGWTHVGRSFDGAHYAWDGGRTNVTAMGALATRGVFQVNGWRNLDTALGYAAVTRQEPGKTSNLEWRLFGIYYQDWRDVAKTDNRPAVLRLPDLDSIRLGTFGGHAIFATHTQAGTVDALLWGALQTGAWGNLDHGAGALAVEAGWQPPGLPAVRPWLRIGFWHGSGDGNPVDGDHGTFFQILPTPRAYARFPFYNLMNIQDLFGQTILRPHGAVSIKAEAHWLRLADRNDLWYLGGGAFQPQTFGYIGRPSFGRRGLAALYDISADWRVNPSLTLHAYFGHARGSGVVEAIYPGGPNANFGYVELLYRF